MRERGRGRRRENGGRSPRGSPVPRTRWRFPYGSSPDDSFPMSSRAASFQTRPLRRTRNDRFPHERAASLPSPRPASSEGGSGALPHPPGWTNGRRDSGCDDRERLHQAREALLVHEAVARAHPVQSLMVWALRLFGPDLTGSTVGAIGTFHAAASKL